jgi:hypothetical protein
MSNSPFIILNEPFIIHNSRNQYGGTVRELSIRIEAIVEVNNDKHPATVSNELLGDIEKALIMGDMTLDEFIDDIQDVGAEITQQPFYKKEQSAEITQLPIERRVAGATIDFQIRYTTEWGDPYTQ